MDDEYKDGASDYMTPTPSLLSQPTTPVLLEPPSPHPSMTIPSSSVSLRDPCVPAPIVVRPFSSPSLIQVPSDETESFASALTPKSTKEFDLDLDPHYLATPVQRSYFIHLSDLFEKTAEDRGAEVADVKKERRLSRVMPAMRRQSVVVTGASSDLSLLQHIHTDGHAVADETGGRSSWLCCCLC